MFLKKFFYDKKEISDVILIQRGIFHNAMTGKKSNYLNKVVRKKKKFIILNRSLHYITGSYIKYDEKDQSLHLWNANLVIKNKKSYWEETSYAHIFKDGTVDGKINYLRMSMEYVDICGQSIISFYSKHGYEKAITEQNIISENTTHIEKPDNARKEMIKFIKTCDYFPLHNFSVSFFNMMDIYNFLEDFKSKPRYQYKNDTSGIECVGINCSSYDCGDIPEEMLEKMNKIGQIELKYTFEYATKTMRYPSVKEPCVGYIQNINGTAILRCFRIIYFYRYEDLFNIYPDKVRMQFIEYKRVVLAAPINVMHGDMPNIVPIHRDKDMRGTALQYTISRIDETIDFISSRIIDASEYGLSDILGKMAHHDESSAISTALNIFTKRYCANYVINYCMDIYNNPIVEKIMNLHCKNIENITSMFDKEIGSGKLACDIIKRTFGTCYEKQELHKAIGIPKGLIEYVIEERMELECIKKLKNIFYVTDEAKDFFLRMNKEQWEKILCQFAFGYINESIEEALKLLIKIFGPKNYDKYAEYAIKISRERWFKDYGCSTIDRYLDYLSKLDVIGEPARNAEWKLNRNNFERTMESVNLAYYSVMDKTKYKEASERFKYLSHAWEKYYYKNGGYFITYPKQPSEVLIEGFTLNHCVKSFIQTIANDGTTILFIRKENAPGKPFYTLEIRNNMIRQCHGVNNCNADDSIRKFLKGFCKEKNVVYADMDKQIGI